ncbi:hypothetical protein [Ruania albidiflava]|uniref:hypothetical protein n=1 Tax=Ruania albidiflava TaxID=366586 RepID=UPI0023EFA81A|nr:hypothetical protein [Ruania albidiflava]
MNTTPLPRRTTRAAGLVSAALLLQCLVWLVLPDLNPYIDPHLAELRAVLPLPAHAGLLAVLALAGTVSAGVAALRPADTGAHRAARAVAPVVVLGLFGATASMQGLSLAGYVVAMVLPLAAIGVGVVAAVRSPRSRWPLALALAVGIGAIVVFRDLIRTAFAANLSVFAEKAAPIWAMLLTYTALALWVALSVRILRDAPWTTRATAWLVAHRRLVTVLAALGPLPYPLARLTWLTPWPIGLPEGATDAITAWGLMLSLGAWMGAILTLGLILPWGERLPRWLPRVGGRPVPPAAAIVPGSIVAGLVCLAAVPWTITFIQDPTGPLAPYFFLLPLGYWGPMLALAVWAYGGYRSTGGQATTGPDRTGHGVAPSDPADTMVR